MAKILEVKIKRTQTVASTHYDYPLEYDPKKIQVLVYESILPENYQAVVDRGNKDEYLIGVVSDVDATQFLVSQDIQELDYNTAIALGETWVKQVNKILDQQVILNICEKVRNAQALTEKEKKALDPDDTEPGIGKSRGFQEGLDEMLVKL